MANDRDELMRLADRIAEKRREGSGESIWLATLELDIRTLSQRHTEQCCTCGKRFDAREQSEGGGPGGAQLTDGRWTCSADCWEFATAQRAPQNGAVPEGMLDLVEALDAAMVESLMGEGADIWKGNRGKLRNRLPENVGAILAKMRALLAAAPAPEVGQPAHSLTKSETRIAPLLRAMAMNYSGLHIWDHLDAETCRDAANLIDRLIAAHPAPESPEAERAKGEACGYVCDFDPADEMESTFYPLKPGESVPAGATAMFRRSAPPPAGQPEGTTGKHPNTPSVIYAFVMPDGSLHRSRGADVGPYVLATDNEGMGLRMEHVREDADVTLLRYVYAGTWRDDRRLASAPQAVQPEGVEALGAGCGVTIKCSACCDTGLIGEAGVIMQCWYCDAGKGEGKHDA